MEEADWKTLVGKDGEEARQAIERHATVQQVIQPTSSSTSCQFMPLPSAFVPSHSRSRTRRWSLFWNKLVVERTRSCPLVITIPVSQAEAV